MTIIRATTLLGPKLIMSVSLAWLVTSCSESASPKRTADGSQSDNIEETSGKTKKSVSQSGKCLNLVNGTLTTAHPAVVMLASKVSATNFFLCTGTYIADNAIVTAAHCLSDPAAANLKALNGSAFGPTLLGAAYTNGIAPSAVFHGGTIGTAINPNLESSRMTDIAILIFPKNTAPEFIDLADSRPATNQSVTVVGFGIDNFQGNSDSAQQKRTGSNRIGTESSTSMIAIAGRLVNNPTGGTSDAVGAQGDSGGPILVDNKLAGVFSSYLLHPTEAKSLFVDIKSTVAVSVLTAAANAGARIKGYYDFAKDINDVDSVPTPTIAESDIPDENTEVEAAGLATDDETDSKNKSASEKCSG